MPPPVNAFNRVQQWGTMARQWWLYDAYGQDVFMSGRHIRPYLLGRHKPLYHPKGDNGDHVVVVNSQFLTMEKDLWERVEYFHHTGYPGGASWTPAWEIHQRDPTSVLRRQVSRRMSLDHNRRNVMERLHIYPTLDLSDNIAKNISAQIRQIQFVPKKLHEFTQEQRDRFPRLFQYPKDFIIEQ